jgi:DNA-binding helix-hairpin-helix protein with protein kinase domain
MYDGSGRCIPLGRELGRGFEGHVSEVAGNPGTVAKVYHTVLPAAKVEKLRLLPAFSTPALLSVAAWPNGTLADNPGGAVRGILLPRVYGREIHFVYSPGQRRQHYPKKDWSWLVHIAMNAAAAVQTVHDTGTVIGDLNQGGFFVSDDGTVRLVDCDSFQIRHNAKIYRCGVRVPHYTPPELQTADLNSVDATVEHDSFGLGILIFHLLFMGRHPFAGRYLGAGDMPIEQAISEHRFAFSDARSSYQMEVPPNAPQLRLVHRGLADLFERAFRGDPQKRPAASDWYRELRTLKSSLRRCPAEQSHMYSSHLQDCPWCALEHAGCPPFFSNTVASFDFDAKFDLDALWRILENLTKVPDDILSGIKPPVVRPRELPSEAKYRELGPVETPPAMPVLDLRPMPELPQYRPPPQPSDPGSGYFAEEEPKVPDFVPATPPPERSLELLPVPNPPRYKKTDFFAQPRNDAKKSRTYSEYRTAKWTSIGATVAAVFLLLAGMTLFAASTLVLGGLGFGIVWLTIWVRIHREYLRNMKVAQESRDDEDRRIQQIEKDFQVRKNRIDEINAQRQTEFDQSKSEFDQLLLDLPSINSERHRAWREQCAIIEKHREVVRERNRIRLQEWTERMRQVELQARKKFESDVAEVRRQQEQVAEENRGRRQRWEALLPQHNAVVRAITELNDKRNKSRQRYSVELEQRAQAVSTAERHFQEIQHRWNLDCSRYNRDAEQIVGELVKDRQKYLSLKASFERERDQLMSGARQAQLDDFLIQQLLANASISDIAQKRKDILSSFGIETAYDISRQGLSVVRGQGFGDKRIKRLFAWRHECERRFVFNSQKQVASPALTKLHNKYQSERFALQNSLRAGLEKAKESFGSKLKAREQAFSQATAAMGVLAQAKCDLEHIQQY